MKKAIIIFSIIFFQLLSLKSFSQFLINDWRLIKISQTFSHDNPNESEYLYDSDGKLKTINYYYNNNYGKQWDSSAVKDFVHDKNGRITGYTKYDVEVALQYTFSYNDENRLINKQIYKTNRHAKKEKNKKLNQIIKYRYEPNKIIESLIVPPSEKIIDETIYILNKRGNIIRQERKDMQTMKVDKYICGNFYNKPNPNVFTGAYFYTSIQSKENGEEGYWANMKPPIKTESTYDANGMVKETVITEKNEKGIVTSTYAYTYAKIKFAKKSNVK